MTKQDFELLARTIGDSRDEYRSNTAHAYFARKMADVLATTNPRFDRSRFILACMPRVFVGSNKSNVWERAARSAEKSARTDAHNAAAWSAIQSHNDSRNYCAHGRYIGRNEPAFLCEKCAAD